MLPALAHASDPLLEEALTAPQWARLLGINVQPFRKRCPEFRTGFVEVDGRLVSRQLFAFGSLPQDYREKLTRLRETQIAPSFAALFSIREVETRKWTAPKAWAEYLPSVRARAEKKHGALRVWYDALNAGKAKVEANRLARHEFERLSGRSVSDKQIYRWAKEIDERGGEFAPLEAYCDNKECAHVAARKGVPEDFLVAVRSKALEPGVGTMAAAVRFFELEWRGGRSVPGLGRAPSRTTAFPFTAKQLGDRNLLPGKGQRVQTSEGKFRAKVNGFLPAPPLASGALRLRERIVFDDKRLDIVAKDDITGKLLQPVLYLAMDESNRQILGYLLREEGGIRQTDVEGLTAFILSVAGFAGSTAGYATTLKFERGTVAISPDRERLLTSLFPGEILISRTSMIGGHNVAGDYAQASSGNFFGKGKIESFMRTLDEYARHIEGQRGNVYANQPLMLGDLLTTPERIISPNYKRKGSMIEEAVLAAQTAQAVHFVATGELPGAYEAARATGVKGPLLYMSELHAAVQAVIAYYNSQRGHEREGFLDIPMVQPNGGLRQIRESSNDKAARLERELAGQGRSLQRISQADCLLLLHKVKRVRVTVNGVVTTINGRERRYWCERSQAIDEAVRNQLGEKEYLALYNPEDPRELYLLRNVVGHVPLTATELPQDEEPHFFEALPLYVAPEVNDALAMAERAGRVATMTARNDFTIARTIVPFLAAQTERRENNRDLAEPVRAAVSVLRDEGQKVDRPTSQIGQEMAEVIPGARREQREAAQQQITAAEAQAAQDALRKEER